MYHFNRWYNSVNENVTYKLKALCKFILNEFKTLGTRYSIQLLDVILLLINSGMKDYRKEFRV